MSTYDGFPRRALFGWALQVAQSAHDGATQVVAKPGDMLSDGTLHDGARRDGTLHPGFRNGTIRYDQIQQSGARGDGSPRQGKVRLHRQREHESRLSADLAARAMLAITSGYFHSDLDALHAQLFRRRRAN